MISSMTGFGAAEGMVGDARASVEIRTVNHRFFSPNLKLPPAFARWEGEIREILRQKIARGHVALTARVDRAGNAGPVIDEARLAQYANTLKELQKKHALGGEVDLATVLRLPDVVAPPSEEMDSGAGEALAGIVAKAVENLIMMRRAEGAQLAAFLLERVAAVETRLARIETRAPIRLKEHHERVKRTVSELIGGAGADPQRIAQEIAILADKLDVAEELDRFRSHLAAFRETARSQTADPVGKRLGFILQEMVREANTVGSKASDAQIQEDVIAIKEELERIREQVENLE
ncbi:MAG: YicC family protein [Gemmatimonadetes bacterium]|nr:MAG: YicC family protein [Gemmatimonadota bacterium]PYP53645.1 MAG: YicC family protein [Gemmatimonadota bacterium]